MAKKIIQDIVSKKKPEPASKPVAVPVKKKVEAEKPKPPPTPKKAKKKVFRNPLKGRAPKIKKIKERTSYKRMSRVKIFFVLLVFVLLSVVGTKVINGFSKIIIQISPHKELINIDLALKASETNSSASDLPLEIMRIEINKEKSAVPTGVKEVETKASGQIIIYNAFSSATQPLVRNTRFETPDGKIYRIKQSLSVPGASIKDGETIPGSIEATVYADEAGEEYNISLTDFTIPGFKGGPRFDKFYARSKTPMSGGFMGKISVYLMKIIKISKPA
jgi:hypothetical protein